MSIAGMFEGLKVFQLDNQVDTRCLMAHDGNGGVKPRNSDPERGLLCGWSQGVNSNVLLDENEARWTFVINPYVQVCREKAGDVIKSLPFLPFFQIHFRLET